MWLCFFSVRHGKSMCHSAVHYTLAYALCCTCACPTPQVCLLPPATCPRLQREDLAAIVAGYLSGVVAGAPVAALVDFYLAAKAEAVSVGLSLSVLIQSTGPFAASYVSGTDNSACQVGSQHSHMQALTKPAALACSSFLPALQESTLQDGAGHKPAYNLRTLCRALEYAAHATPTYGLQRSLWDGFAMSFLTQLDPGSGARLEKLMQQHLLGSGTSLKVWGGVVQG